jgi:hypothetical protein
LGISNLIVSQFVDDQLAFMKDFGDHVIPAFRAEPLTT